MNVTDERAWVVLQRGGGDVFHAVSARVLAAEMMALVGAAFEPARRWSLEPAPRTLCGKRIGRADALILSRFPPGGPGMRLCRVCERRLDGSEKE